MRLKLFLANIVGLVERDTLKTQKKCKSVRKCDKDEGMVLVSIGGPSSEVTTKRE